MSSATLVTFPFSPTPKPGIGGPFYKFRSYMIRVETLLDTLKRWEQKRPGGLGLSPLAGVGHVEFGTANKFIHIWPYPSLDTWMGGRRPGPKASDRRAVVTTY
jgi:hypothetical protein